jgi:PLP dependent protein
MCFAHASLSWRRETLQIPRGLRVSNKLQQTLEANLAVVEERLAEACRRAGRARSDITLVAVTKSVSANIAGLLPALGVRDLGENRPQELIRKAALLPPSIRWHMIGHLQRNKIDRLLPLAHLIQSVDSVRLLEAVDKEAARQGRNVPVFLEINASGEESKQGFGPAELPNLCAALQSLAHVQVRGLMTMAALQDPEACRPTFARLRNLRDKLRGELKAPHDIEHLSMGMSNDFEVAIEEGATFVRIGTLLFAGIFEDEL